MLRSWFVPTLILLLALLPSTPARADSVSTRALTTGTLAPGVYTIRHPDPTDDFPDGNTTAIVGERGVLVIDTCYLPSSARADIERIRAWTGKPVRYVLNTHWHNDHNGGNHEFLKAFPTADVVAHHETKAMMDARLRSYVGRYVRDDSAFGRQRAALRREAEQGTDEKGAALTGERRAQAARSLARLERARDEFQQYVYQPPTLTFDSEITLDLGGREVQLRFLGRGNTGGDVVAYLPRERILVAGDLIDHPVPYAFGGYPSEWLKTLRRIEQMDIDVIVPGHGEVLKGKTYVTRLIALLESLQREVSALVFREGSAATPEAALQALDLGPWRREMAGDDTDSQEFFDASMASLVRLILAEAKAR